MFNVEIAGTGHYVPSNIVKNEDIAKLVDTSDEWIVSRTGIRERRISENEDTSDLAAKAAIIAIENAGLKPYDIELIIVATTTQDNLIPSTACMVQNKIGADAAFAFDIFAACSGFIFALNTGYQFLRNGTIKNALIIGSEVLSKVVDWSDRNTCVLMGDGAGAVVIKQSLKIGIANIYCGSKGENGEIIKIAGVPYKNPYTKESNFNGNFLRMNGKEVFQFASQTIENLINRILREENLKINDIKYIIPHQANLRIIEYAAKKFDVPLKKFYINLDKYGNTSSASIPIALDEMNRQLLLKEGDRLIFIAFGGGLTFGATLINWVKN